MHAQERLDLVSHELIVIAMILYDVDQGIPVTPELQLRYAKAADVVLQLARPVGEAA